ncbi:uncharacterized protein AMSG_01133 [Thecamonas trahens ATCC 50062]|uniref:Diacylglycerol kinase n=1 Tax=Thecamonas trahens ATCC 50062 TaxID=461836 RepID=A0A0L0DLM8_THETB|nr:hypothetical protein AMSG_01133 [Thecamonas trahens ATCC 50062]KNC52303.1 hypothetical protein AMSG_01133 [Thecamonas trahens ATCC 50062]|eukprot:XP_013762301.1 hypothetical protein AMSG_01133 [Thecamonas trahens ATCC 50062]
MAASQSPPHTFKVAQFNTPTWCGHCTKLLKGLYHQGHTCTACGMHAHAECVDAIASLCLPAAVKVVAGADACGQETDSDADHDLDLAPDAGIDVAAAGHVFDAHHFSSPAYCRICRKMLYGVGKQGLRCLTCAMVVHAKCAKRATPAVWSVAPCKSEVQPADGAHQWIEGNVPGYADAAGCIVCLKSTKSAKSLTGFHCVWCDAALHSACMAKMPLAKALTCSRGPLAALLPGGDMPLLVLVNTRSGGQQGRSLLGGLCGALQPTQVCDMAVDGGPRAHIARFAVACDSTPFRILGAGGDGTIGWILAVLDDMIEMGDLPTTRPPVAILPLGTGNDLARATGWGPGYAGKPLRPILDSVLTAKNASLDRWNVVVSLMDNNFEVDGPPLTVINNYFSIGVDARVALAFHTAREANPGAFTSRTGNKIRYAKEGTKAAISASPELSTSIALWADGERVTLPHAQAIIIVNIPSYGGGINLWRDKVRPSSFSDGKLEVLAVTSSAHLGRIQAGVGSATKLAQASSLEIRWLDDTAHPVQIDGEPWLQQPAIIHITHRNQAPILIPADPDADAARASSSDGPAASSG